MKFDIFRGEKFVYGHNYLRPHETYHEPTRKFYENEIVCAPLYEAVPLDLVAERCWVLDPSTFCKGELPCKFHANLYANLINFYIL